MSTRVVVQRAMVLGGCIALGAFGAAALNAAEAAPLPPHAQTISTEAPLEGQATVAAVDNDVMVVGGAAPRAQALPQPHQTREVVVTTSPMGLRDSWPTLLPLRECEAKGAYVSTVQTSGLSWSGHDWSACDLTAK